MFREIETPLHGYFRGKQARSIEDPYLDLDVVKNTQGKVVFQVFTLDGSPGVAEEKKIEPFRDRQYTSR